MKLLFRRKPKGYRCYWLALHFASAEAAAAWCNENVRISTPHIALVQGGERIPICQEGTIRPPNTLQMRSSSDAIRQAEAER